VVVYSPTVLYNSHKKTFQMWYVGGSSGSRVYDMGLGYAESRDGLAWKEYEGNPILTGADIADGTGFQTPFVLYDEGDKRHEMWFVAASHASEKHPDWKPTLRYGTSRDGVHWELNPEPFYSPIRSPMVMKDGPGRYVMYANAGRKVVGGIYKFTSADGLQWERGKAPLIRPSNGLRSVVYPWVLRDGGRHYMWYGCHLTPSTFELFCASSEDGDTWHVNHTRSAFAAAPGKTAFDSRYVSTPCVVRHEDRYLLYYSARDWNEYYVDATGKRRRDYASPYAHIGVATMPVEALAR